jgi:pimeloyl-ACP methyl ester carboxylesterase
MNHLAIRVACIISVLMTVNAVTVTAEPATPGATALAAEIAWQPCPTAELPTRECGTLTVPLDYDEPAGPTIDLAVARVPATDQAHRIGSLITNPGGPGGSGVDGMVLTSPALPQELQERFDVVSFDPRGVGQSAPVRCFDNVAERTAFFAAIPSVPIGAQEAADRQHAAEELARHRGRHVSPASRRTTRSRWMLISGGSGACGTPLPG